jgi:(E)-4-hydroxy-3-methylbut-2-enyl-diphosphate synthase
MFFSKYVIFHWMKRRVSREVDIGGVMVGGTSPISVQSMTNTDTLDVEATVAQIKALEEVGCELVRVAVPNSDAAAVLPKIIEGIDIPLIADIHFDYRLALTSIKNGVAALRLNPGNIGSVERVSEVVRAAKDKNIPIRIGVNAGSLEADILERDGRPTPKGMVESAMRHIRILEDLDFTDIKVSLKASKVAMTIEAYKLLAKEVDYPFHIGITEAGTLYSGTIKSAAGIGALLWEGFGDTLRVSLTADPVEEVKVGYEILKSLGLRERGVTVVSCPTCGRLKYGAEEIALKIERSLAHITETVNVAVMGCVVNGPGEAIESDVGIAGGDGVGMLYIKGKQVRKVDEADIVSAVVEEVERIAKEKAAAK